MGVGGLTIVILIGYLIVVCIGTTTTTSTTNPMSHEKSEIFLPLSSSLMSYVHHIGRAGTDKYLKMIEQIVAQDSLSFMNSAKVRPKAREGKGNQ